MNINVNAIFIHFTFFHFESQLSKSLFHYDFLLTMDCVWKKVNRPSDFKTCYERYKLKENYLTHNLIAFFK